MEHKKSITLEDAAYFIGIHPARLRNLIKRGDFADIGEYVVGASGQKKGSVFIKPAAFLSKYALTWEDVFAAREQR